MPIRATPCEVAVYQDFLLLRCLGLRFFVILNSAWILRNTKLSSTFTALSFSRYERIPPLMIVFLILSKLCHHLILGHISRHFYLWSCNFWQAIFNWSNATEEHATVASVITRCYKRTYHWWNVLYKHINKDSHKD